MSIGFSINYKIFSGQRAACVAGLRVIDRTRQPGAGDMRRAYTSAGGTLKFLAKLKRFIHSHIDKYINSAILVSKGGTQ